MTGPEHYREAEKTLADAAKIRRNANHPNPEMRTSDGAARRHARLITQAQVHATLALAAATAEPIAQSYDGPDDRTIPRAWSAAIS